MNITVETPTSTAGITVEVRTGDTTGGGASAFVDLTDKASVDLPTINTPLAAALAGKASSLGADDNYVTDAEKTRIGNLSGTNTGDQNSYTVQFTPAAGIAATHVQAAIVELAGDISAIPSQTASSIATALNAGTQDSTAADTDKLAVTHPAGGWMLLSTLWTWIKAKIDAGMTIAGAQTFSGQVQLAAGQAATDAQSAMSRGLGDARYLRELIAVKTANEDRVNLSVLTDDSEMLLAVEASSTYQIELLMSISQQGATTHGYQMTLTGPSGWTMEAMYNGWGAANLLIAGRRFNAGSSRSLTTSSGEIFVLLKGTVFTSGTAGNIQLQWAQVTDNANYTRLFKGSYLKLTKI